MSFTRRDVIKAIGVAGAAAVIGPAKVLGAIPQARRSLRILFIGGTGFIGPHMVRRALARGHSVTLFNRGRTNPHLFPDLEKLVGDDPTSEDPSKYYGPLKVLCEQAVLETYPDRSTILRPGWIIGAGDYNSISPYWPMRINHGGEVLAPGDPTDPLQIIDPHDLARFVIKILEDDINGIYNTVGPEAPLTMAEFFYGIRAVTRRLVQFTWVPADFLADMDVAAMTDLPIWFPPRDDYPTPTPFEPGAKGFHRISGQRAIAAGLTFRPLAETARSIIDEFLARDETWESSPRRFGLSLEREAAVLSAWRERVG